MGTKGLRDLPIVLGLGSMRKTAKEKAWTWHEVLPFLRVQRKSMPCMSKSAPKILCV